MEFPSIGSHIWEAPLFRRRSWRYWSLQCSGSGAALAYVGEPHPLHRRFNRIMTAEFIAFPKLAGWGTLVVSALALFLLPGFNSRALAQNAVHNETSSQNISFAPPKPATAAQAEDGSLRTESTVPEGNRKSQTSASTQQARSTQENGIPDYYRKWLEEDVVYIISDQERSAFEKLANDEERDAFIEQFWARRNPDPQSSGNFFKEDHYRRIAYADEHFAWKIPGWKTDRGRIYIMFGKPDGIESHPAGGDYSRPLNEGGGIVSTYPFEDWWYRHIDGVGDDIILEFVDQSNSGEYKMVMSPDEKVRSDEALNEIGMEYLKANQYIKARLAFQTMINLYPDSKLAGDAYFAMGNSFYDEGGTENLLEAEDQYKNFIVFSPTSPMAADAQLKVIKLKKQVEENRADLDFRTAKFYISKGNYAEARSRLKRIIESYPDFSNYAEAKQLYESLQKPQQVPVQ